MTPTLPDLIQQARRRALAPEQSLLRMLDDRKATRSVVAAALEDYREAARQMEAALAMFGQRSL